jgi:hypothetical protein
MNKKTLLVIVGLAALPFVAGFVYEGASLLFEKGQETFTDLTEVKYQPTPSDADLDLAVACYLRNDCPTKPPK